MHALDLPQILEDYYCEELSERETEIIDMANTLTAQGTAWDHLLIATHRDAIALANELLHCHTSNSIADEGPHYCAEQLKLWHLRQLDIILERAIENE